MGGGAATTSTAPPTLLASSSPPAMTPVRSLPLKDFAPPQTPSAVPCGICGALVNTQNLTSHASSCFASHQSHGGVGSALRRRVSLTGPTADLLSESASIDPAVRAAHTPHHGGPRPVGARAPSPAAAAVAAAGAAFARLVPASFRRNSVTKETPHAGLDEWSGTVGTTQGDAAFD